MLPTAQADYLLVNHRNDLARHLLRRKRRVNQGYPQPKLLVSASLHVDIAVKYLACKRIVVSTSRTSVNGIRAGKAPHGETTLIHLGGFDAR